MKKIFSGFDAVSDLVQRDGVRIEVMGDFLVIIGIIAFAVAGLGLIWALERV